MRHGDARVDELGRVHEALLAIGIGLLAQGLDDDVEPEASLEIARRVACLRRRTP